MLDNTGRIAWQLGLNGEGQGCFGLVVDNASQGLRWGVGGVKGGGPFFVGDNGIEEHIVDYSVDGEAVSSLHLSTDALFKSPTFSYSYDAPLEFQIRAYQRPPKLPFYQRTHLRLDFDATHNWVGGQRPYLWRWLTEDAIGDSEPPDPPDPPPPPHTPEDPEDPNPPIRVPPPTRPPGQPPRIPRDPNPPGNPRDPNPPPGVPRTPGIPTFPNPPPVKIPGLPPKKPPYDEPDPPYSPPYVPRRPPRRPPTIVPPPPTIRTPSKGGTTWREYRQSPLTHAFSSILLKSNYNEIGQPDLGDYSKVRNQGDYYKWVEEAPIVGIEESYGGFQSGTAQSYQVPLNTLSQFACGTGAGGKLLYQPQLNIANLREFCNTGVDPEAYTLGEVSELNTIILPLTYQSYGYPDLDTGGFKKGWRVRLDLNSKLNWSLKTYAGTETTLLKFPDDTTDPFEFISPVQTDGDYIFKSGTSYKGTQRHNNSADRTYDFQDKSGTIAHLDDITAATNYWDRSGTTLFPANIGDTVQISEDGSEPRLTTPDSPTSGLGIFEDELYLWTDGTFRGLIDFDGHLDLSVGGVCFGDIIAGNRLKFYDSTSFSAEFVAAHSANRTHTLQDSSGTLAYLADIVNQGWTRSGTNLAPTNAGDTIGMTDSASAPQVRGVTDTNSGISVASDIVRLWCGGTEAAKIEATLLTLPGDLSFNSSTAFLGTIRHNNSASRNYDFQDVSGTVALTSDIVNQGWTRTATNLAPTNAGDTIGITQSGSVPTVRGVTNTGTGTSVSSDDFLIWSGGTEAATFGALIVHFPGNIRFLSGTSFRGIFDHANTGHRTYTFQDSSYTVAAKTDKTVFIPVLGSISEAVIHDGDRSYAKGVFPADFSSITSMYLLVVNKDTDDTFNLDLSSEYGSSTQQFDTHTSTLNDDYNLTEGELELIDISGRFGSVVAGDFFKFSVANNHASKEIEVYGIQLVYATIS